ncbi:MAG: replicative DNA helicase [Acidobacteriaceae bacterium]
MTQDPSLDAGLPSNPHAERTILGAILLDNAAHAEAAEVLKPDDFSLDAHRRIFLRMGELIDSGRAVDIVTLSNELSRYKEVEAVGGVAYLASLTEGLPWRPIIEDYIRIVKDKSQLRRLMSICSAAIARAADQTEDATGVIEWAGDNLQQMSEQGIVSPLQTFGDFVGAAYPSVDEVFRHSARSLGLPSGLKELDALTCGFQRKQVIIVAARPGMGKTSFGLSVAAHAALDLDRTVAFFSLEMRKESLLQRLVAMRSTVSLSEIRDGKWSDASKRYALEAMSEIVSAPLYIDAEKGLTPRKMQSKAARLKAQTGHLDLVVIDQLNHIQAPAGAEKYFQRRVETGFVTRALGAIADALDVPVIVLHQLNRENEKRDDKRPRLSDLRESGSVEEDADLVLFPHRPGYYDPKADDKERRKAEIIVAKQREGPSGVARCEYLAEQTLFRDEEEKASLWGQ